MSGNEGPKVRTLQDHYLFSKGRAKCKIGSQPALHSIPAGRAYHKVVEIVDDEFRAYTMCPEHDIFFASVREAEFVAELAEANHVARKGWGTFSLVHALNRYGDKSIQAVDRSGNIYLVRDVLLAQDGKSVILWLE